MLLEVEHLIAGHGAALALHDVSLEVPEGGSLAVLGRNGAGKTTLIETLMGLTTRHSGEVALAGQSLIGRSPVQRARAGLGWVPQEREVFPSLTVTQNLTVVQRPGPWNLRRVIELFPRLGERAGNLGSQLSGGEQQMLAIGRALMTNPKLLLLDEPMEGLAPIIVEELADAITAMVRTTGLSTIVIEQHPVVALAMSSRAIIVEQGRIVHRADSQVLAADTGTLERYLGVGTEAAEAAEA
jgi:branched-chain amino acid transport system ATP-binding protein